MHSKVHLAPDFEISRIITGLWQIADIERKEGVLSPSATAPFMEAYVKNGFTSFDMADHYGSSEVIAGHYKNNLSEGTVVELFTKWVPEPGQISKKQVRESVQRALDRMQQTSIDLLQFHAWFYPDPSWLDALFYLKELKEEGLIKHIGLTNFDAAHLRIACASGIPIVSNQICHSLLDQRANFQMKEVCEKYHVKLLAFGTLAGGFLTDKWYAVSEPAEQELTTWSQMKYKRFIDTCGGWEVFQNLMKVLKKISQKHSVSIANVASGYILQSPQVASIIIGARLGKNEHIEDNNNILSLSLDQTDLKELQKAMSELKPIPGGCGDEYRKPPFLTASGDLSHHLKSIPKVFEVVQSTPNRQQIFSGTEWEEYAGYSRAVKQGNSVFISGTTATHGKLLIGGADPAAQTHFIIDKIEAVLHTFNGRLSDVVRSRIFVHNLSDWEAVARVHGERFKGVNPANTLVASKLVGDGYLVEIEIDAVLN